MNRIQKALLYSSVLLASSSVSARPLITEHVASLGKNVFEVSMASSYREDAFGPTNNQYESVYIPAYLAVGLMEKFDLGFQVQYAGQRVDTPNGRFSSSASALLSSFAKYQFTPLWSLWGSFSFRKDSDDGDLPINQGQDVELRSVHEMPVSWPLYINLGYVWRGDYSTGFGIEGGPKANLNPGDFFEAMASLEVPIKYSLNLLGEVAYYNIASQRVAGEKLPDSAGEACDALVGLTWDWKGWKLGSGVAFGLLDESHTSFDLTRGAGDVTYKLTLAYSLKARRPSKWKGT